MLGPELAFDALWYHLTLPKIYLDNHTISYIPGGLLYYSAMPQLTEMLYISALAFQGEILAKFVHFMFGILTCIVLYRLSRKLLDEKLALLVVLVFYSNLVIGWESITAYVDLARTFYEVSALFAFLQWVEDNKPRWLILSGILIGLATASKLLALGSVVIILILLVYFRFTSKKFSWTKLAKDVFLFSSAVFLVISPWLLFSFINTGNPVFPFFTNTYPVAAKTMLLHPMNFLSSMWKIFLKSADPISPIYLMVLPLIVFCFSKFNRKEKIIIIYSVVSVFIWYITPRTGGGRFILPYLPVLSLVVVLVIHQMSFFRVLRSYLIGLCLVLACISIVYRAAANAKYIDVIMGNQTKAEFLTKNLKFSFGDFYDIDNHFENNIKEGDVVLLYGFHNLYYVEFPFIHESWIKKGDKFNYIAVQGGEIPKKYSAWRRVYENRTTNVVLYKNRMTVWE